MAKRRKHKRVSASDRKKILAEMAAGGLTAKKVAKKYGVSMWTIYGWRKRKSAAKKRGRPARARRSADEVSRPVLNAMIRSQIRALLPGMVEAEIARVFRGLARS